LGDHSPSPAPNFLQGDTVAGLHTGLIQPGGGFGIDDFLLT